MSKKRRNHHHKGEQESKFEFEEAKDLTVGQAIRKNEEVEAGVTPEDTVLDKYIKQHREEIEADKFENLQTKKDQPAQSLDDMIQEVRETTEQENTSSSEGETIADAVAAETTEIVAQEVDAEETKVLEQPFKNELDAVEMAEVVNSQAAVVDEGTDEQLQPLSRSDQPIEKPKSKKKLAILSVIILVFLLILGGSYYVYRQISRSSQEIQTKAADSGLVSNQSVLEQFNTLYDTFYTDENKTALKNSQFSQLNQLKELLDKLEGAREYTLAKSKYDSLETQIKAIQEVNSQFETPAITDGVLDTNAKIKADAKFTDIKTGNTEIDKLLDKAISLGKSQLASTTTDSTTAASQEVSSPTTESSPSTSISDSSASTNGGLSSEGVNLQRGVSRVPYNQSAVNDSSNPAWTFADGVLERILETSRARGYITGNKYILERVNIVNGNGYYNLYKPDGTYLFTLNCKTGYFVGNGSGHADDLDY
ncbi:cell division site-positioning protein MapZ [Streptococcus infantis]|uniref:cell division site-positioning protein MapZ n=1 Tax=Streptococcus infantis TaxID=68892 RepID=UPI0020C89344|nr:cell division site-positioning protein MapZ family protein [Streptococcus infantis]MCP9056477.1 cell division site-positioning protein MapZ family protein [Streptococcus infantis]MCP9080567.1 cell division site-positioning protein MapZ family protein [Streptococcus infantis]